MRSLWKEERGVLAIDATISLCSFMMLIMFLIDIGGIYRAQNYVYHGMLQTTKQMSVYMYAVDRLENESSGTETQIEKIFTRLFGTPESQAVQRDQIWKAWNVDTDSEEINIEAKGGEKNIAAIAELMYPYCVGGGKEKANQYLIKYGIKDGLNGISFEKSKYENKKDIVLDAVFEVQLMWPVFGIKSIDLHQSTKSRVWIK